jgi:YidC/Oxa1 family membrane protein insertase
LSQVSVSGRPGKPQTQGYYVLHEGLIGVLGGDGLQEYTYDKVGKEPAYGGGARVTASPRTEVW